MYHSNGFGAFGAYPSAAPMPPVYKPPAPFVGTDTSSKDPVLQRARIFAGNLNTHRISRNDIIEAFSQYGHMIGLTVFKGYAFIQYSNSAEADLAISAMHGFNWHGSALDVKLAVPGIKDAVVETTGTKRPASEAGASPVKRTRLGDVQKLNRDYAAGLEELPALFTHFGQADTLICGECRFVTNDLGAYVAHKKTPCSVQQRPEGEPEALQCFSCEMQFENSWQLVKHLTEKHQLTLFKPLTGNGNGVVKAE
ncbi:hnrpc-prov protein [Aphelenchoides avenae]|nr:hnrpc-prov protein [Aphelenchus avenae]